MKVSNSQQLHNFLYFILFATKLTSPLQIMHCKCNTVRMFKSLHYPDLHLTFVVIIIFGSLHLPENLCIGCQNSFCWQLHGAVIST